MTIKYQDEDGTDKVDIDSQADIDTAQNDLRDKQSIHFFVEYTTPHPPEVIRP